MEGMQHEISGVQHEISVLEVKIREVEEDIREKDQLIEVAATAEERQRYEKRWDRLRDKEKELHEEKKALRRKESSFRRRQSGIVMAWIFISKGLVAARILISKGLLAARNTISKGLRSTWLLIVRVLGGVLNVRATISTAPLLISSLLTNPPTEVTFGINYDDHIGSGDFGHHNENSKHQCQGLPDYPTGLDKRVHEIQEQLENGVVVGIVGMGGIGKSTLAKQLFNNISPEYEYTCYFEDVRRIQGLDEALRRQFRQNGVKLQNEFGIEWNHLKGKKTLIVMDDVDSEDQLKVLPLLHSFGNGSHLIITSRDRDILNFFPQYVVHEVKFLEVDEAKKLFCHHAKMEEIPMTDHFEETLKAIIDACAGLPLTLEVVGRYLRCHVNDANIWEETLEQLGRATSGGIIDRLGATLKVSYDSLVRSEQEIFIEAGTFFFEQQLEHALVAWRTRYKDAESRWANLVDRALVKTLRKDKWDSTCEREIEYMEIWVHEVLRDLAKNVLEGDIVSGSNGGSNTLKFTLHANWWRVHTDLNRNENETMVPLDLPEKSEKLKYIDLDGVVNEGLGKKFPSELVLLKWKMRSMSQLPPISLGKMKNLAILEVENWSVWKFFCEALGNLRKLRILSLCNLEGLDALPKTFGELSFLEHLTLNDVGILELPKSFGGLSSLVTLKIRDCSELSSLPETFGLLSSLEELYIYDCTKLSTLGESFGHLHRLKYLSLKRCESLVRLPASFKGLQSLKELVVDGCSSIQGLSNDLGQCKALERLTIQGGVPKAVLSGNFWSLPALKYLTLKQCWKLEGLPAIWDLPFLEEVVLEGCDHLQRLPENFNELTSLKRLVITGAYRLKVLPHSVGRVSSLREVIISDCNGLQSLPSSFRKPFLKNDQDTELGKTTDREGVQLAITDCELLKDEILRKGFVYKDGYWYPKRRHL